MTEIEKLRELLIDTASVLADYEEEQKRKGVDFNIFQILEVSHLEVPICRVIREMLDPEGSHGKGILFLKAFLNIVLKQNDFSDEEIKYAVVIIIRRAAHGPALIMD